MTRVKWHWDEKPVMLILVLVLVPVLKDALGPFLKSLSLSLRVRSLMSLSLWFSPCPHPCCWSLPSFLSMFFQWFTTWNRLNRNTSMKFALTYLSCPERQLTEYFQLINESVPDELSLTTLANSDIDSPSSKTCSAECAAVQQQLRQWSEYFRKVDWLFDLIVLAWLTAAGDSCVFKMQFSCVNLCEW